MKEVAKLLKAGAKEDNTLEQYTQTEEEADKLRRGEGLTEEEKQTLLNYPGGAVIHYNKQFYSLQLTTDDEHGHKWHLSMCQLIKNEPNVLAGKNLKLVSTMDALPILQGFFSTWQRVETPGMIKEIIHFVGND